MKLFRHSTHCWEKRKGKTLAWNVTSNLGRLMHSWKDIRRACMLGSEMFGEQLQANSIRSDSKIFILHNVGTFFIPPKWTISPSNVVTSHQHACNFSNLQFFNSQKKVESYLSFILHFVCYYFATLEDLLHSSCIFPSGPDNSNCAIHILLSLFHPEDSNAIYNGC